MSYSSGDEHFSITQWAEADRPREKLVMKGRSTLSDAELIAILIGSGTVRESAVDVARKVLQLADNDLHRLAKLSLKDLQTISGIGQAKAISIAAALELGRRRKEAAPKKQERIMGSQSVYELMKPELLDLEVEEFWVILVNNANAVIDKKKVSEGGLTGTVADPRKIFKLAIEHLAAGIVLVHNHPSGKLKPSRADRDLTRKMVEGGRMLQIHVLDHLIFSDHQYYSFADEGVL